MVEAKDALPFLHAEKSVKDPDEAYFADIGFKSGPKLADEFGGKIGFHHSVASGSPTDSSVVIWTRFTPATAVEKVPVTFMMAEGKDASALSTAKVLTGSVLATPGHDWIVKLDVNGLKPNSHYVYGFSAMGATSVVGHTRTAPAAGWKGEMTYAMFSCSQWETGIFHAYDVASRASSLQYG